MIVITNYPRSNIKTLKITFFAAARTPFLASTISQRIAPRRTSVRFTIHSKCAPAFFPHRNASGYTASLHVKYVGRSNTPHTHTYIYTSSVAQRSCRVEMSCKKVSVCGLVWGANSFAQLDSKKRKNKKKASSGGWRILIAPALHAIICVIVWCILKILTIKNFPRSHDVLLRDMWDLCCEEHFWKQITFMPCTFTFYPRLSTSF